MNDRGHYGNAWMGQNQLPVVPGPPPGSPPPPAPRLQPRSDLFAHPLIYLPVLGGAALGALLTDKHRITGGVLGGAAGGALVFLYAITHLAG